jgi:hypothetical protein
VIALENEGKMRGKRGGNGGNLAPPKNFRTLTLERTGGGGEGKYRKHLSKKTWLSKRSFVHLYPT